jgi:LPXTG-motif cell wall-anchored protein
MALALLMLPFLSSSASAAVTTIDIDGDQTGTTDDWQGSGVTRIDDKLGSADTTRIKGDEATQPWQVNTGTPAPKSDIGNVLVYDWREPVSDDVMAAIAWDRGAPAGTGRYFIELNQASHDALNPVRTEHDLKISIGINGNDLLVCQGVQQWTGTAWGAVQPCDGSFAFAVNAVPIVDYFESPVVTEVDPDNDKKTDNSFNGIPANQFLEVRLNLTDQGATTCPVAGFRTIHLRSQEGNENGETSALKDYAVGPISIDSDCGSIEVVKQVGGVQDSPDAAGAVFMISPDPTTGVAGSHLVLTTGSNGRVVTGDVKPGTYSIEELVPPDGYLRHAASIPDFTVTKGAQAQVVVNDVLGDVSFTKTYQGDEAPATGATFTLTRTTEWVYDGDPADGLTAPEEQPLAPAEQRVITVTDNGTGDGTANDPADGHAAMGHISVAGLEGGSWTIVEQTPPTGWKKAEPDDSQTFVIGPTDTAGQRSRSLDADRDPATFHNLLRPIGLELTKLESDLVSEPDLPHPDVVFNLYQDDGDGSFEPAQDLPKVSRTTGSDGKASWSNLDWQKDYWLEEVEADGYAVGLTPNPTKVSFTAPTADDVVIDFGGITNPREEISIALHKVGDPDGALLDGGSFRLYRESGETPGFQPAEDVLVNAGAGGEPLAGGRLTFAADEYDLPWGFTYYLYEETAPAGYGKMTPNPITITEALTLDSLEDADSWDSRTRTLSFDATDPQLKAAIRVLKYDATQLGEHPDADTADERSEFLLGGATFGLFKDDGDGAFDPEPAGGDDKRHAGDGEVATGGTLTWSNLEWGTYWVVELDEPTGYGSPIGADPQKVVLGQGDAGAVVDVVFENPRLEGRIRALKYDASTLVEGDEEESLLDGAGFQLWLDDGDDTFDPDSDEPIGDEVESGDQGETGEYLWSDLEWGTYWVQEVYPPQGYDPPLGAAAVRLVIDAGNVTRTQEATFENARQRPGIQALKHDADAYDESNPNSSLIDGAEFKLYLDDGDATFDDGDTEVTDPAGERTATGVFTWTDLEWGSYWVVEDEAPAGYEPAEPGNQAQLVVLGPNNQNETVRRHFYNERTPVDVRVLKIDAATEKPLAGAEFKLYEDGGELGSLGGGDVLVDPVGTTGADGTFVWSDLDWGAYILVETKAPPGYVALTEVKTFTLGLGDATATSVTFVFENSKEIVPPPPPPPGTASVRVLKVDGVTGSPIDTAKFKLWRDSGSTAGVLDALDSLVSPGEVSTGTSGNAVGTYLWSGLGQGAYLLQETAAPTGYDLSSPAVQAFTLTSAQVGTTVTKTVRNPQQDTTVEVVKVDDETGEVLEGARFQAYEDDGTTAGVLDDRDTPIGDPVTTDADGESRWAGLLFGSYLFEEVTAPAGYGLPADPVQAVTITAANAGGVIALRFLDPALGALTLDKAAFELNRAGGWVASDGRVDFGDRVKYVVTATADGPKVHHDVVVSDFIPGYDPDDTTSDTHGTYVAGTAVCVGAGACTVTFDDAAQLLTWELGDLRDEARSVEFVIEFPEAGDRASMVEGVYTETLANTAAATWTDRAGDQEVDSNEVVVDAEIVVLPAEEERPPAKPRPPVVLPATGAPSGVGIWTTLGGLLLAVGALLMMRRRRDVS